MLGEPMRKIVAFVLQLTTAENAEFTEMTGFLCALCVLCGYFLCSTKILADGRFSWSF